MCPSVSAGMNVMICSTRMTTRCECCDPNLSRSTVPFYLIVRGLARDDAGDKKISCRNAEPKSGGKCTSSKTNIIQKFSGHGPSRGNVPKPHHRR